MSTPAQFSSEVSAMFAKLRIYMDQAPREYIVAVAADVIITTPGPGNQSENLSPKHGLEPAYVAKGVLRGGWSYRFAPGGNTSLRDGPADETGADTLNTIEEGVKGGPFPAVSYLVNNILYGIIIFRGEGTHSAIGPRPWTLTTANFAASRLLPDALAKARTSAGF